MKSDFDNDMLVEINSGNSADVQLVGDNQLLIKLSRLLVDKGLKTEIFLSPDKLDVSKTPSYIYWFPVTADDSIPETFVNYCRSVSPRLIIVYLDMKINMNLIKKLLDKGVDVRGVEISDLYGPGVKNNWLSKLSAKLNQNKIVVPENDYDTILPIFINDAAEALIKITFSSQVFNKSFFITGSEETTFLNFAYRIKEEAIRRGEKISRIINSKEKHVNPLSPSERKIIRDKTNSLLSWRPATDLRSGITETVTSVLGAAGLSEIKFTNPSPIKKKHNMTIAEIPVNRQNGKKIFTAAILALVFLLLLISPPAAEAILINRINFLNNRLINLSTAGDTAATKKLIRDSTGLVLLTTLIKPLAQPMWTLLGRDEQKTAAAEALNNFQINSNLMPYIGEIASQLVQISKTVSGASTDALAVTMIRLESSTTNSLGQISQAFYDIQDKTRLISLKQKLNLGRELLPVFKWFIGFDKKRTVLIVLQNSAELRPTGGFISEIGFLTMEKGKILDLSFNDIYQIDSQLPGSENPPEPVKKMLGENGWLTRDSNWSPDVPASARQIKNMVKRATGRDADGVVFITTGAVKTLLKFIGPIKSDIGVLTYTNIVEKMMFKNGFAVDSDKQPSAIAQVVDAISQSLSSISSMNLARGIIEAIEENELMLVTDEIDMSPVLNLVNINGRVMTSGCPTQFKQDGCLADSIFIVEANLGVNKADYYLKRGRDLVVNVSPNESTKTELTLTYTNTATGDVRPSPSWRGYIRVLTPLGTKIESADVTSRAGSISIHTDTDVNYGKTIIGFYLDVPPGEERRIAIRYSGVAKMQLDQNMSGYNLLVQKQPGIESIDTTVTINYDSSLTPVAVSPSARTVSGSLVFYTPLNKTTNIAAQFALTRPML